MENLEKNLIEIDKGKLAILDRIASLEIRNTPEMEQAVALTKRIKEEKAKIDEIKDLLVKPLKVQAKAIEAKLKPRIDELDNAESMLKQKMVNYTLEQDKVRLQKEEILRKEQEKKYLKELKKSEKEGIIPPPPPEPVTIEKQKIEGFSMRMSWDYRIINVDLIPRDFMIPDDKKIRKCILAGLEIKGIQAFQKPISAVSKNSVEEEI